MYGWLCDLSQKRGGNGANQGSGEREEKEYFFPPLSLSPFPSFAIAPTIRAAIFTHPNLPVIQSNTAATTIRI